MSQGDIPAEVVLEVFQRDGGCLAPRLGGSAMDCFGRNRIEHVKKEARMGARAEPLAERLVTLCEGHTETGMKAGYVWATDQVNRGRCRDYLLVWAAFRSAIARFEWQRFLSRPSPALEDRSPISLIASDQGDIVVTALAALGEGVYV